MTNRQLGGVEKEAARAIKLTTPPAGAVNPRKLKNKPRIVKERAAGHLVVR